MKRILLTILFVMILSLCCYEGDGDGGGGGGDAGSTPPTDNSATAPDAPMIEPGTVENYAAGTILWNMIYVPPMTFPNNLNNDGTATVSRGFWIGETEVTWQTWYYVHKWSVAREYYYQNQGVKGNDGAAGKSSQHPVTGMNWRDAMVFCNALTAYYNNRKGARLTPVYTYNGSEIKDARDTNATACNNAVANPNATGFRLLTGDEFELAARWRHDATNSVSGYTNPYFTKGDSASGATANCSDHNATGAVAWCTYNSDGSTHEVKSKQANYLGLYDMSGNVWEWCFKLNGSNCELRGGGFSNADHVRVSYWISEQCATWDDTGFRLATSVSASPLGANIRSMLGRRTTLFIAIGAGVLAIGIIGAVAVIRRRRKSA